jgi:glucosamine--fructose-6-phosphate aminotransferase (isomerizing)
MCGIVGHIGTESSAKVVLEGLQRLEYRGYDSAGICFKNLQGALTLFKKTGKLVRLLETLQNEQLESFSAIGHIRWATHGEVNTANSHPHLLGKLAIVHNGIIENAQDLKEELQAQGHKFQSETDSEVFLGLLHQELQEGSELLEATSRAFKRIKGNSAFVIQSEDSDGLLFVKRGVPLVSGVSENLSEGMVSSDPYALMGFVSTIFFPEDEVVGFLNKEKVNFYELNGTPSQRYVVKVLDTSFEVAHKGQFEHFMLKEIYEQPGLIRKLSQIYLDNPQKAHLPLPNCLHVVGCGTAYYAGMLFAKMWEDRLRIPTRVELASEFRYKNPLISVDDLAVFISQSGETADTLAAMKHCAEEGITTCSIVNVEGSTLFREVDQNFLIHAGKEVGVASTKAFTQQVLTGRIFCEMMSANPDFLHLKEKIALLASRIEGILGKVGLFREVAGEIYNHKGFFFTGRGQYYPIALEGALKLKEIAYVHAEGYASGELKHGPMALIDEQVVNLAIVGPELFEKTISNIQEIKARKGIIIGMGPDVDSLRNLSDFFIPLSFNGLEELAPLYVNVANQLLTYHVAKKKGTDIDRPRNLAKSVTVE